MNQFNRIHLVILSHNRLDCLPRLFDELLLPAVRHSVQVTFVDNASGADVHQFLSQFENTPDLEIIMSQENLGVAGGRNLGFKRANREFVVYLDDDSLMSLDALERIPALFDELPDAGILAFRVVHGVTRDTQNEHGDQRMVVGNFHGAGHAFRRSLFDRVGYLDETCFFGAEEIEFSMRALVAGMKTIYTPEINVRRYSFRRTGKDSRQRLINWARNYAMVLFRYLPETSQNLIRLFSGCWGENKLQIIVSENQSMDGTRGSLNDSRERHFAVSLVLNDISPGDRRWPEHRRETLRCDV